MAGVTIGTHSGRFHCDEAFACYMLKMLPQYADAKITRTRDPAVLETCDIVVDVGGVFDPAKHRYDHHQRDFVHTLQSLEPEKPYVTKLSSAGLVYKHFGREIINTALGGKQDPEMIEILFDKLYQNFVEEIDACDNGISQYEGTPKFKVTSTISSRIGRLGNEWNTKDEDKVDDDVLFAKAMEMVGSEFVQLLTFYHTSWWPARDIVKSALLNRFEVHSSGEIIVLEQCPWKAHLYTLEEELSTEEKPINIKYALFGSSDSWRVQCVSKGESSFENRLSLPEPWRGVRDEELSKLSGIPDCVFVHAAGFIGGNKTKEGAHAMAVKALEFGKN